MLSGSCSRRFIASVGILGSGSRIGLSDHRGCNPTSRHGSRAFANLQNFPPPSKHFSNHPHHAFILNDPTFSNLDLVTYGTARELGADVALARMEAGRLPISAVRASFSYSCELCFSEMRIGLGTAFAYFILEQRDGYNS